MSAALMDQYQAKPLRKLEGFWRVDGTSDVEWSEDRLKIGFVLSRLKDDYSNPFNASAREDIPTVTLVLSPRWLSILTVGSIWQGGKRVSKPSWLDRSFEIDTCHASNQAAKLKDRWATKGVVTELSPKTDQKGPSVTLYAVAPIIGDKEFEWLVIPHSEIFRFYVAVSGRVTTKVLNGEISDLIDLNKPTSNDPVTIFEHVKLKEIEAKFFGRLQANKEFKDEIFQINKRFSAINVSNTLTGDNAALVLEARFPFSGRTNLSVSGIPMQLANKPAIYVMEIHHCTYPLGFSSLIIESSGNQTGGGRQDEKGNGHKSFNVPSHDPDDEDEGVDDSPADATLQRREISQISSPFPEDADIHIEYRRNLKQKHKIATYVSEEMDIEGLTLGDGNFRATSQNMLGAEDVKEEAPPAAREMTEFFEMLQGFEAKAKRKRWSVDSRAINGSIPLAPGNPKINKHIITSFPMLAGKKRTWHLIETEEKIRTRQLACIEVKTALAQRFFYILEMELKDTDPGQCTLLVRRRDYQKITDDDFNSLLKLTSYKNRWPDFNTDTWKKSKHRTLADAFNEVHLSKKLQHPKNRDFWCDSLTHSIFKWLKLPQPEEANSS
ncbi:hypothetical protein ACIPL1_10625 [Pseudomonas sp. NPDC090202]|uniref:hypothetical protein n=1 Tax=Pseudomonas sp. NPDC090202 TaxID=3364476 RepID=UPI00380AB00D